MDQLNDVGDTYYIPNEGIHLVKLDDGDVLVLDNTVINRKLLTTFKKIVTQPLALVWSPLLLWRSRSKAETVQ